MRRSAFDEAHQFHTGYKSTLTRLRLSAWWPSINKDVRDWVARCNNCNKWRPRSQKGLSSWPSSAPFERVHADWCFIPQVGNLLLFVDSRSGWIEVSTPSTRSTSHVIAALSSLCSRFGVPKQLVTDNAPEFTSRELNQWCLENGISKLESPPYHPESNGVAERGVRTIKEVLRAWTQEVSHLPFVEYLKRVLLHHRACFRRSDGKTPAEVVFGRQLRLPLTKGVGFGDSIFYRSRQGNVFQGQYLMPRSPHTAWLVDESNRLRLLHSDQISVPPPPLPESTPTPAAVPESPLPLPPPTPTAASLELSPQTPEPAPSPAPLRRSTRPRAPRVPCQYDDL